MLLGRLTAVWVLVAALLTDTAVAQTEIHKCVGPDGGVVYSQFACDEEKLATTRDDADDTVDDAATEETATSLEAPLAPFDATVERYDWPEKEPVDEAERAACKKRYRDAIDAIDAEILREYTDDKKQDYQQRLLALTAKLRAC